MGILKKIIFKVLIFLFFIAMFLFPAPTLSGASNGLLLWFQTILPTLLPFIILSNMMIRLNITGFICKIFGPFLSKLLGISPNGSYPLLMGFVSGFPMGAKASADMVSLNKISQKEGQFLISLCNNPSIMFITGYIAVGTLNQPSLKYIILGILFLSTFLSAYIGRKIFHLKDSSYGTKSPYFAPSPPVRFFEAIDSSIMDGFEVITKVGGYIILFSILSEMILTIGKGITALYNCKLFASGILEITSGANFIGNSPLTFSLKFLFICTILAFGGLSSLAQTYSVIAASKLSIELYLKTKIINAVIAFLISCTYIFIFYK